MEQQNTRKCVRIVGVDCATENAKTGIAFGVFERGALFISHALGCAKGESASCLVSNWLSTGNGPALLAIDAPLGWPKPLSIALREHRAGDEITIIPNEMFRRATDRFVQDKVGKTPLDVGADRIARTAVAALSFLGEVRRQTGKPIPLAWEPLSFNDVAAIEVYPGATLIAHDLKAIGYKRSNQTAERDAIIKGLASLATLPQDISLLRANADVLDAAICAVAARDFLLGNAISPPDRSLAENEGWIWTKSPKGG